MRAVLGDPRLVSDPHLLRDGAPVDRGARSLINRDGVDHARLRGPTARSLNVTRVRDLRPRIAALVEGLLDDLPGKGGVTVELGRCREWWPRCGTWSRGGWPSRSRT